MTRDPLDTMTGRHNAIRLADGLLKVRDTFQKAWVRANFFNGVANLVFIKLPEVYPPSNAQEFNTAGVIGLLAAYRYDNQRLARRQSFIRTVVAPMPDNQIHFGQQFDLRHTLEQQDIPGDPAL
jgi:hypothetical protein